MNSGGGRRPAGMAGLGGVVAVAVSGALGVAAMSTLSACSDASYTGDGFPIDLPPTGGSPARGLLARRATDSDPSPYLAIDTASPLTFVRGRADGGSAHMTRRSFDILGNRAGASSGTYPRRASFHNFPVLP